MEKIHNLQAVNKLKEIFRARKKSSVRDMECRNMLQPHAGTFEQIGANKISSGWKPTGVGN